MNSMTNRVDVGSRSSDSQRSVDGGFDAKHEYTARRERQDK